MKVWHYTPYRNWASIHWYGLEPSEAKVSGHLIKPATWCWPSKPGEWLNFGHILSGMIRHHATMIACLELTVRDHEVWTEDEISRRTGYGPMKDWERLDLHHTLTLGPISEGGFPTWELHTKEPYRLLKRTIPPDRITLLGVYGISDHGEIPAVPAL